jgi:hypothetical protein
VQGLSSSDWAIFASLPLVSGDVKRSTYPLSEEDGVNE